MGLGGRGFLIHQDSRLDDYHRRLDGQYTDMLARVEDRVVESVGRATIFPYGIELAGEGLESPASTWTYMTDESPFGDWLERIFIAVVRSMARKRKLGPIRD